MICYKCEGKNGSDTTTLYGYPICEKCKSQLRFFKDETIKKYISSHEKSKKEDPSKPSFKEDIEYRLKFIEKDYINKKIKLLHIQDRLKEL